MIWLGFFYTWNQILWTNYLYNVFCLSPCCGLGGKWVGVKLGRLHSYLSEQKNICVRLIDWGFKSYVFYSQLVYSFSSSFLGFCCWFSFLYLQDIQKAHARQIVAVFGVDCASSPTYPFAFVYTIIYVSMLFSIVVWIEWGSKWGLRS